jgi:AraC-like DNA-binding protein
MKVVQFSVPLSNDTIVIEEDILPYFYNYLHRHSEMQITYIVKGEGTLVVDSFTQPFATGDIYLIGPNQTHWFRSDHKYINNPIADSVHAIHIYIDCNTMFESFINLPELSTVKKFIENNIYGAQIPKEHSNAVGDHIKLISKANGLKKLLYFVNLMEYLACEVKDCKSLSTGILGYTVKDREGMRINAVYQYTLNHYANNINLEAVAEICHMTPQAFCKFFKKHTSKTYVTFLQEIRVSEACKRIIKGHDESISAVAYSTGFNSPVNFNKVFKKITGFAPTEYLKRYRNVGYAKDQALV